MLISISGNMGVGKSTLVRHLQSELGWTAAFEPVDQNPFLEKAYQDRAQWNFKLQMYYLEKRLKTQQEFQYRDEVCILDRSVHEGAEVFLKVQLEFGMITAPQHDEYLGIYHEALPAMECPALMVGLQMPFDMLLKQIRNRGREFELKVDQEYVRRLHETYDEWFENYSLGLKWIVDHRNLDLAAIQAGVLSRINCSRS